MSRCLCHSGEGIFHNSFQLKNYLLPCHQSEQKHRTHRVCCLLWTNRSFSPFSQYSLCHCHYSLQMIRKLENSLKMFFSQFQTSTFSTDQDMKLKWRRPFNLDFYKFLITMNSLIPLPENFSHKQILLYVDKKLLVS